jgi:probable F420-dependent oxidoreductase
MTAPPTTDLTAPSAADASARPYAVRPARVGLQLQPQQADYAAIRRTVAAAEEIGADVVFNWDHFFPLYGDADGKHFECWTMLGGWAEATERVEIGALVTCNSYRNPDLLADMARTVDHISEGRLILGIGSGWFEKDYDEYGYEFGTAGSRLRDLGAALPLIKERWRKLNPSPLHRIPILIGGSGEKVTLRIVAEHADEWHTFGTPETLAHKASVLEDWCAKVGRDPGEIVRSTTVRRLNGERNDPQPLLELGFTDFVVSVQGPDWDLEPLREALAWRDTLN